MSSSGRSWKRKHTVIATHYDSKALADLLYPEDGGDQKEEHPLRKSLIKRLSISRDESLVCDEKNQKKISSEELKQKIESGNYECCVIEVKEEKPPLLVGYRFYRKKKQEKEKEDLSTSSFVSPEGLGLDQVKLIPIDIVVNFYGDKTEDEEITSLLNKVPCKPNASVSADLSITINSSSVVKDSLCDLAIHVKRSTSFWYGGFFGGEKESALQQIAEKIRSTSAMTPEKAEEFLLAIAYAAFQTRGSGHRLKGEKIIPTKSGEAFVKQVFYEGGNFTHLRGYFKHIPYNTGPKDSKYVDKNEKQFDAIYRQLMFAVKLEEKRTIKGSCCPRDYQEVIRQEPFKGEKIIPTKSGEAFVKQVFYEGGNFTHLRGYFKHIPYNTGPKDSKYVDKNEKQFDAIYRQLMFAVKLEEKRTIKGSCCPRDYQEVIRQEPSSGAENRYIRPGPSSA